MGPLHCSAVWRACAGSLPQQATSCLGWHDLTAPGGLEKGPHRAQGGGFKKLILTWVVAAMCLPALAQPPSSPPALRALMSLLAQRKHGHVTYVEEHFISMLERPLKSSGVLVYDAPDHLEKRTLRPKPETLVLEHGIITAHRGRHTYTLRVEDDPQIVPLIDSIRSTLAGDLPALHRTFKVGFHGSLERWHLSLTPREASVSGAVKQIDITGAGAAIHTVEIREKDGDRSLMTLGAELPG